MRRINEKHLLEQEVRNRIYEYIKTNPRTKERELARILNIPSSTFKYHLRRLEEHDLIVKTKKGEIDV